MSDAEPGKPADPHAPAPAEAPKPSLDQVGLAKELLLDLRREIIESKKLRAQITGVKVTFATAAATLILANLDKVSPAALAAPAIAAACLDLHSAAYDHSIKRVGLYLRHHVEPVLREATQWPAAHPLWQHFMLGRNASSNTGVVANSGFTLVLAVTAAIGVWADYPVQPQLACWARAALTLVVLCSAIGSAWVNTKLLKVEA